MPPYGDFHRFEHLFLRRLFFLSVLYHFLRVVADLRINKRFPIECDLTAIDWEKDIQVLWDQESIILHYMNVSGDIKGFTLIIEYDTHDDSFTLCNQKYLGKYWHETIER